MAATHGKQETRRGRTNGLCDEASGLRCFCSSVRELAHSIGICLTFAAFWLTSRRVADVPEYPPLLIPPRATRPRFPRGETEGRQILRPHCRVLAASAILSALLDDGPVLILCPSTLTFQWQTCDGTVAAKPADRLPQQFISQSGHGNPAALSLAEKGADHIVGQLWRIQGSGHGWGRLRLVGEHENAPTSQGRDGAWTVVVPA